jgi:hypothetical protein
LENISLDRLLLGHNQFFGVNHMSTSKGIATEQYFSKIENVIEIIRYAYSKGAKGLMLSTHSRAQEIADAIRMDPELSKNLNLYILLPYIAKYVRMANEKGIVKMVSDTLSQASWAERFSIGLTAGMGIIKKDHFSILKALIDIEMLMFKGLNIKAIFLHNSLTDLAVALEMVDIVNFFNEHIKNHYKAVPAYCTLSSGLVLKFFNKNKIENPILMAPFNPIGFQMSPSKEICEYTLRTIPNQTIAMSILAAGFVKPVQAVSYLKNLPEIKSVVVGASSKAHIDDTFKVLGELQN